MYMMGSRGFFVYQAHGYRRRGNLARSAAIIGSSFKSFAVWGSGLRNPDDAFRRGGVPSLKGFSLFTSFAGHVSDLAFLTSFLS